MAEHVPFVSTDEAKTMLPDACAWYTGQAHYLSEDSPIRQVARRVFHKDMVTHLNAVCAEVFFVVAQESVKSS